MNNHDFDTILLESRDHTTLDSFFKAKRQDYRCKRKEFEEGIKGSINRLKELYYSGSNEHFDDDGECWLIFNPDGKMEIYEDLPNIDFTIFFTLSINGKDHGYQIDENSISYYTERIEKYFESLTKTRELCVENLNESKDILKDYSELLNELSEFIEGISPEAFNYFIKNHKLPKTATKAIWKESQADAYRFARYFDLSEMDKEWEDCFVLSNERILARNTKPKNPDSKLTKLLNKHLGYKKLRQMSTDPKP